MILDDAALVMRAAELLGRDVRLVDHLGGSTRSTVLRLAATSGEPATMILKHFARADAATNSGGYGMVRELAGLQTLELTPDLLAVDPKLGLLVMSDLGAGPTLADVLLGDNAELAWSRCEEWARAVGRLCAGGRARVADFSTRVAASDPDSRLAGGMPSPRLPGEGLARLRDGGVEPGPHLAGELALFDRLIHPDPAVAAVSPGDFCPDNVIFTAHGPRFCDLEGSSIHHLAMDAAYVVMPFGTCWCLYDAPADFVPCLTRAFRRGAGPEISAVLDSEEGTLMLQVAGAFTVAMMTELSWEAAHGMPDVPAGVPTARQRLFARWRWAAVTLDRLPVLQEVFARAVDLARDRWPAESLTWPAYPAFARLS